MKVLSRFASPAGFALVLLLFFLLPFLSVSCDVPGIGTAGVNYSGSNLVTGSEPSAEVPDELRQAIESLPGGESQSPTEDPPDADVQVLAIITVVLAVLGIGTVLVSRLRARLFGTAGVALATLAMAIVTLVVARSNLEDVLLADAEDSGVSGDVAGLPDIGASIEDLINTEVGFWLVVVLLALIAVLNAGAALFGGRLTAVRAGAGAPGGLPFTAPPPAGPPPAGPPTVDPLTGQPSVAERPTDPGVAPTFAQPPATEPPAAQPPAVESPATEPPAAQPPADQPPVAQPSAEPPAPQPPESEPPASGAPPADPPTQPS